MADFKKFAPVLLEHEGGFVNDPDDKGGATNMGVTLRTYQAYCGSEKNVADLMHISYGTWQKIMKDGYWDRCRADEIVSQSVAEIMVDWCVNSGSVAIKQIQTIVGIKPDGMVGPLTLAAINGSDAEDLFNCIKLARIQHYENIIKADPVKRKYRKGWMNRVNSFVYEH